MGEYKIVAGKLVKRTVEEQAEFDQKKAEYYSAAEVTTSKSKMPKTKEKFAIITGSQAEKLKHIESFQCVMIFLIMSYESFRHRGKPFQMPTDQLAKDGFSRTTQRWAVARMEKAGLILVERRPPRPPTITVL